MPPDFIFPSLDIDKIRKLSRCEDFTAIGVFNGVNLAVVAVGELSLKKYVLRSAAAGRHAHLLHVGWKIICTSVLCLVTCFLNLRHTVRISNSLCRRNMV